MARYHVVRGFDGEGEVFGVACGTAAMHGLTGDRAVAELLADAFNEEDLAAEHLGDVLADFAHDPAFFLRCLEKERSRTRQK